MFELRAPKGQPSRSIMIAFHAKWHDALRNRKVSVVFRKFGPRHFGPKWIYAYLTQPISAVVAKLEVTNCQHMTLDNAARVAEGSLLTKQEVLSYGARWEHLYVFGIGSIRMAIRPITFRHLADAYGYWPDSTFIPLTPNGEAVLDELGGGAELPDTPNA